MLAALITAQLIAAGAVVAARSGGDSVRATSRGPVAEAATTSTSDAPSSTTTAGLPVTTTGPTAPPSTRPPAPVVDPGPGGRLQAALDAALAGVNGCVVVRNADGSTVYAHQPNAPLAPASTQKLLVAVAALSELGPDFRFETKVVAPAAAHDGAVDGLWLVGGGDPTLATPEYGGYAASQARTRDEPFTAMAPLVDALVAAGVKTVNGGVHGDDSRYDRLRWLPTWKQSYRDDADVGPLGALTVNDGLESWGPKDTVTGDPAALASGQLARLLSGKGVTAGGAGDGTAPAGAVVLARVQSAPLGQLVAGMLRASDNLAAELVTRELDHHAGGAGTTAGGTARVIDAARRLGIPVDGVHMVDGSGLDSSDRNTCVTLLSVIDLADRPGFTAIGDGLAVAARTGTLASRFGGTPVAGRLAAKTGWIDCAIGMVGRMTVKTALRFSFLGNGQCAWAGASAVENRVVMALASYPS